MFITSQETGRFSLLYTKLGDLPPNRETWKLCNWSLDMPPKKHYPESKQRIARKFIQGKFYKLSVSVFDGGRDVFSLRLVLPAEVGRPVPSVCREVLLRRDDEAVRTIQLRRLSGQHKPIWDEGRVWTTLCRHANSRSVRHDDDINHGPIYSHGRRNTIAQNRSRV